MSVIDLNEQYAAVEIRQHVLPLGYGQAMIPKGAAIEPLLSADLRKRGEAVRREYDDAWNTAVAKLDPKVEPHEREAGYNRLQLAQDAAVAFADEVSAWLDENIEQLRADAIEASREDAAKAYALVVKADEIMKGRMLRARAVAFAGLPRKRYTPASRVKSDPALDTLLTTLERQAATEPEWTYVSQPDYNRMLAEGADLDGVRVRHNLPTHAGRPS